MWNIISRDWLQSCTTLRRCEGLQKLKSNAHLQQYRVTKWITCGKHLTDIFTFLCKCIQTVTTSQYVTLQTSTSGRTFTHTHTEAGDKKTKVIILCIKRTHYSECIQERYSTIYIDGVSSFSLQRCAVTYVYTVMAGLQDVVLLL